MGQKAVFWDFDDTWCATSEHDVPALAAATAAASTLWQEGALTACLLQAQGKAAIPTSCELISSQL